MPGGALATVYGVLVTTSAGIAKVVTGMIVAPMTLIAFRVFSHALYPALQILNRHEVDDSVSRNFCSKRRSETKLNKL